MEGATSRKRLHRCLLGTIAFLIMLSSLACMSGCFQTKPDSKNPTPNPLVGKTFQHAGYTWRVLDSSEDMALVITEDIFESRRFDDASNDWSTSELREYLNGEFYDSFSSEDQSLIVESTQSDCGTKDKVFLLSADEVASYFNGPQDCYAEFLGSDMYTEMDADIERWWWLRTPGQSGVGVMAAGSSGIVTPTDNNVFLTYYGVRPAMVVNTAFLSEDSPNVESEEPSDPPIPDGAIDWTEAGQHVGETVTVFGPVASTTFADTSNGQPAYINIGASYPDPNRLSVVVWGEDRANFPEPPETMYTGKTICVTGEVYLYGDACNIKVKSPDQIQVVG